MKTEGKMKAALFRSCLFVEFVANFLISVGQE
jgi:hypothetical protein